MLLRRLYIIMLLFLLIGMVSLPVSAAPWHFGGGDRYVGKNETINGDLIFQGDRLEVDGEIKGDLLVFAGEVIVNGQIDGSVLGIVTQKLTVTGRVGQSLRALAGEMNISGKIGGSFTGAANLCTIPSEAQIGGVLGTFIQLKLGGLVNGPVEVTGQLVTISGRIHGDVQVKGNSVAWLAPLEVTGKISDFTARANSPRGDRIVIQGGYRRGVEKDDGFGLLDRFFLLWIFVWFIVSLLMSLIFLRLFPFSAWRITEPTKANFRRSLVVGLAGLVGLPLVAVILALTVVGIPIAILLGIIYVFMLLFLNVPLYLWLGRLFFPRFRPTLALIMGGVFVLLVWLFPGPISIFINFFLSAIGFGLIAGNLKFQVERDQ